MLKIQYASDLHLELNDNIHFINANKQLIEPVGDILLLAGDIAYLDSKTFGHEKFKEFFDFCADNFEETLIIPGNHEFYDYYDVSKLYDGYCKELRPNVKIYYNSVVNVADTDFILSTMWSYIPQLYEKAVSRGLSDFYRIKYGDHKLTAAEFNMLHQNCMDFIKKSTEESEAKHKVVVTHHLPSMCVMATEFIGSSLNGGFVSEQCDFIKDSDIDYWVYGHSHRNIPAEIGNTKLVCNQLGYVGYSEHSSFIPYKMFELD